MNLNLTRAEVAAVIDYVYQHVRATEGKGRKVYEKMQVFMSGDNSTVECPLFQTDCGGSSPASPLQLSDLIYERCSRPHAIRLNRLWHSRLPLMGRTGIQYSFHARRGDCSYAVAIWSPPVARMLPKHWLELRRLACSPEMPKNGASQFLNWMVRYFRKVCPERDRLISYQDTEVHAGTIYKAAGWKAGRMSRENDTWKTGNRGRQNINGDETIASAKVRWEMKLRSADAPKPNAPEAVAAEQAELGFEQ